LLRFAGSESGRRRSLAAQRAALPGLPGAAHAAAAPGLGGAGLVRTRLGERGLPRGALCAGCGDRNRLRSPGLGRRRAGEPGAQRSLPRPPLAALARPPPLVLAALLAAWNLAFGLPCLFRPEEVRQPERQVPSRQQ